MPELDDICDWYEASRVHTQHELEDGKDPAGTKGYKDMGCFDCNGYNTACKHYSNVMREDK